VSDIFFRGLGIHIESYLDPYTKMKAAIGAEPEGVGLEEAYATRFGLVGGLNVTVGKFRQQLGVVNRWHKHALDQIDFPLALRMLYGPGGLVGTGFSFDWTSSALAGGSQGLMLQVTKGENPRVFAENSRGFPSLLLRTTHYRDLSKDTYLEMGATGLLGWNDAWTVGSGPAASTVRDRRDVMGLAADLSLRWEPTDRMRYSSFEARAEYYQLTKQLVTAAGNRDEVTAWGAYLSLDRQVSRTVHLGVRGDYYVPDTKAWAGPEIDPLAVASVDAFRWQAGPYLAWWQSPFVRVLLEADYSDGDFMGPAETTFTFQTVFAAGPHKHERY
jgi:hypothetical protein